MNEIIHNNCKSCTASESGDDAGCYIHNQDGSCPCTTCLVKPSCEVFQGDCEKYDEWWFEKR